MEEKLTSGVQELIEKLRQRGINEGREEAEKLLAQAHREAKDIIDRANADGENTISQAKKEAEHYRASAREALKLAARDTILDMKSTLTHQFARRVGEMVAATLTDHEFLKAVILEIAGHMRPEEEKCPLEIFLPKDIIGLNELRRHPEKVKEGKLGEFVLGTAKEMLRDEVLIKQGNHESGLSIKLVDEEVRIDLTEESITELLLEHLLPRFRALPGGKHPMR